VPVAIDNQCLGLHHKLLPGKRSQCRLSHGAWRYVYEQDLKDDAGLQTYMQTLNIEEKNLEIRGFEPLASRVRSVRSTN
jgi:hypothetical protein